MMSENTVGPFFGKDVFSRDITSTANQTLMDAIKEMPKIAKREELVILASPEDIEDILTMCREHGATIERNARGYLIVWHQEFGEDFVDELWTYSFLKRDHTIALHKNSSRNLLTARFTDDYFENLFD